MKTGCTADCSLKILQKGVGVKRDSPLTDIHKADQNKRFVRDSIIIPMARKSAGMETRPTS